MKANEAFDSVCSLISEKYKDSGWKYSKSSHWMTKKDKRFTYKVFFYTSWNNISDVDVTFHSECAIIPLGSKNNIYCATIRQCDDPNGKLFWNIAKEKDWEQVINEFTNLLDIEFMPIVRSCIN